MSRLDKELKAWKELYDNGSIDEATYNRELDNIINSSQQMDRLNNIERQDRTRKIKLWVILIIVFGFIGIKYFINLANREYEQVEDLYNIQPPIQTNASGSTIRTIDDVNFKISFVAKYILSGRVVDVQDYLPTSAVNKLSSRDIGMTWGKMGDPSVDEHITWRSTGNRFLNWETYDMDWLNQMGGVRAIKLLNSNNHLIPANAEVEQLIKTIRRGDYIKIEGYLVNVDGNGNNGYKYYWHTSTTRGDSGNGACEIIYVEKITWLK